jgi:hypothetical protein
MFNVTDQQRGGGVESRLNRAVLSSDSTGKNVHFTVKRRDLVTSRGQVSLSEQ